VKKTEIKTRIYKQNKTQENFDYDDNNNSNNTRVIITIIIIIIKLRLLQLLQGDFSIVCKRNTNKNASCKEKRNVRTKERKTDIQTYRQTRE
jgi:ABC-type uncharacterized transport system permease subunit